ncbi:MAG: DNA polymerase III subunit gamma/tau [Devosia sp.]|nr:DNA polymerase III subunit gamma/tau [Devosia sp.]
MFDSETPSAAPARPYVVLARKYRPVNFDGLIGQDAMVTTLRNAFKSGRIPHAFMLTGIRGVGKTTTARILARALNYEDETGRHPTLDLGKEGVHDRAIIEGRHVDVIEMDAASNTGINDIREIIDSVKYAPVSAPNKVYVIDEVHMLSTAAFNGLLKTLEEPPPYVKFIFATTEIRKVPVTVLSRCMRFDLRRISAETMLPFLADILAKEGIEAEPDGLAMIVRAGEGSARDCLSLLDQAISYGAGKVTADAVKAMLGLADRARTIDLFEALMAGSIAEALQSVRVLYEAGADPVTLIADLTEFTHLVTRIKIVPSAADDVSLTPDERRRGAELAQRLGMRALSRAWQILFKGYEEVTKAGNPLQAAEMVLIRLAYAADLPSPDELLERLANQPQQSAGAPPAAPPRGNGGGPSALRLEASRTGIAPAAAPTPQSTPQAMASPRSYAELVALAGERRDLLVKHALEASLSPISFAEGRIEVALTPGADPAIIQTLSARLKLWTGRSWMVSVSNSAPAAPTIRQQQQQREEVARAEAHEDPLVRAILETFPGAKVKVRLRDEPPAPPAPSDEELEAQLESEAEFVPDELEEDD